MATLNVKGLPDGLYRKLQARAKRERRSVAQEVTLILAGVLENPPLATDAPNGVLLARERGGPGPFALPPGERGADAVIRALRNRLERVRRQRSGRRLADDLNDLAVRCAALPVLDPRSADDILGYDDKGLPR